MSGAYAAAPADKKKNPAGSVHQSTTHPPTTQPPITHGLIHSPCILAEQSRGSTHGPGRAEIGALPLSQNPGRGKLKCSIPGKKTNEKEPYTLYIAQTKKAKQKKSSAGGTRTTDLGVQKVPFTNERYLLKKRTYVYLVCKHLVWVLVRQRS